MSRCSTLLNRKQRVAIRDIQHPIRSDWRRVDRIAHVVGRQELLLLAVLEDQNLTVFGAEKHLAVNDRGRASLEA